ncbi:putative zinc alcohol [Diaporthe ampelina]|uniref:Putative zinc alcohol n=1 Tax=Diaporthe ampelina TaxID=1214573 RepID=A0A0G2I5C1_9PEZI|nr:putative zinc alcohol [Diaporthe ampelina]
MATPAEDAWPQTMRAWTYNSASGGLDKALQLQASTPPPPKTLLGKDSVLVRVSQMSLNPADYKLPELGLLSKLMIPMPASPGMDFSGTVAAVGSDVEAYQPGQKVFGRVEPIRNKYGALAEYVVAKDGGAIAAAPQGWGDSMDQLACVGTCGLTALQSIQPYAAAAGDRVFINGGSGGTGTFGIQIAKALGLHVTVSCSGANAGLCRGLGADEVVDYKEQDVSEVLKAKGKVFRLVVDNVGYTPPGQEDLYTAASAFLLDDGHFVQVGGGASASQIRSVVSRSFVPGFLGGGKRKFVMVVTKQSHEGLARIGEWMKEGKIKAVIDEVFQYEDAPKAYTKLKTGRAKGKIVVVVAK